MICSKCGKRPAVVFLSSGIQNDKTPPKGYCLICAKELGNKQVNDMLTKMGITDDDVGEIQEQMDNLMSEIGENGDLNDLMKSMANPELLSQIGALQNTDDDENGDSFTAGGASTFPNFVSNIFGGQNCSDNEKKDENSGSAKVKKDKNRKYIGMYCDDLTKKARSGVLDRIIGRDKELERVIQILSRRSKNNPCLIGEPGVGKTAIAEALALRIASGNVPQRLKNKEIQLLDLTALIAGTQFRGQFESRIKGLMQEIKEAGNIILFIDEIHNLVGTAGDSDGSMNAANILKPALSRGELQVIGATTFNEYRKYIEKDSALERRFQPVKIGEPSVAETVEVISGIKSYYELHHNVTVDEKMVRKIVVLSERYITDRFLPDKAIDLLDEACACAALGNKSREEYEKLSDKKKNLSLEKERIIASESVDYENLATVQSELAQIDQKLSVFTDEMISARLTEDDIAKVIELWTGIPSSRIKESELSRLSDLENQLKEKIVGQDEAVEALASAIKRSRVQISPRRRPASFIFAGPTGVGKTELVKVLAQILFDTPETLIRLDMSEYMEKHSVSRLVGAPPGYVGYEEGGQLTEAVRRKPYSVVLFDEIEKAHPDVFNVLLQVLDDGRITDSQGRTVDFKNTILIMTSNIGAEYLLEGIDAQGAITEQAESLVMGDLRNHFRPEFLNRLDETILFKPLTRDNISGIIDLIVADLNRRLADRELTIELSPEAAQFIVDNAYDPVYGARPLKRYIQKYVETLSAKLILSDQVDAKDTILITVENGALAAKKK